MPAEGRGLGSRLAAGEAAGCTLGATTIGQGFPSPYQLDIGRSAIARYRLSDGFVLLRPSCRHCRQAGEAVWGFPITGPALWSGIVAIDSQTKV